MTKETLRQDQLDELRRQMGTLPDMDPPFVTPIYWGVKGIDVKLIDMPVNPYKAMFTMATSCWGKKIDKWDDIEPDARLRVVKAVLDRQALPLAYEAPKFTFAFERISRWAFDQIVRARLGVVWSSMGQRDNSHQDIGFRVATNRWPKGFEKFHGMDVAEILGAMTQEDLEGKGEAYIEKVLQFQSHLNMLHQIKFDYESTIKNGKGSWQDARDILPMCSIHRFSGAINFAALQSICGKRMMMCEADQVVAVGFLLRREVEKKFPLMAQYLRPNCDWAQRCTYHSAYSMSELFGCLFKGCGRWPESEEYQYAHWNESCADHEVMERQMEMNIFHKDEKLPKDFVLTDLDKALLGYKDYHLPSDFYVI